MAEELEALWSKLTFTEEEGEDIALGSNSTKATREIGKNCVVMKILTKRIIFLEVLRKNMKMLWKPNKGLQISEIEDDMFLVEFGDGRDKKRIMEMSPWSFEKQLILMQDFEVKPSLGNRDEEGCRQYGAWLRGEPGRRVGKDPGKAEEENRPELKQRREEKTAGKQDQDLVWQGAREGVGEGHVMGQRSNQKPGQIYSPEEKRVACQAGEINYENGKSNLPQEKGEEGLGTRRMVSLSGTLPTTDTEGDMQWENTKDKVGDSSLEEKARYTEACCELGLEVKKTIPWAEDLTSPLAMSFDKDKGWVTETLGPNNGHWKRLARQTNKPSPVKRESPEKLKRSGPVPLQELDPNALNNKRKKGKL
nr:hypothetical protein CFP56_42778 [Quercus suber]